MGGKKQAQRTKNNVRPSSSGRSAELLGNSIPQFAGFSILKDTGLKLSLPKSDDVDLEIDTNFQLVFKKMNKKDSTTKLKALQEFADLVKNSDAEAVKAVLPFWPRLYNALATDLNHKVREATHVAHNEVVKKVKRNLAPYLKLLIAPWFTSQYDTYPPAATAATLAFNNAFPENKVEEAITFCSQEILNYIHQNLLVQTPQTLTQTKTAVPEEAEAKYERILISSLHGYALYLNKTQPDKIEKSLDLNRTIVSSGKFWKYAKHNVSVVRSAWFEVLAALFQRAPFLLENEEGHVVSTILGNIDETDPVVLPLVWQNVLLTITTVKEWWTKVNIEKVLLPKLWKILKEGGHGNASVIYPNLLPLLSNLVPIIDINTFYNNFFQNLHLGLKQKSVISSASESVAVSTSLIECIRYVVMKNSSDVALCEKIIKMHLMPTLEWCLLETQSCYKTIFNETASLVQYWSRNNTAENPNYFRYLNYFWNNIDSLFQGVLMNFESFESENICNVSDRQIQFIQSMKHTAKIKKRLKVTFDTENESGALVRGDNSSNHPDEFYFVSLTNLVFKICQTYVKLVEEKKSRDILERLVVLIQEFESEKFFVDVSKKIVGSEHGGIMVIYENLLEKWLKCDLLWCKSLIDLIFTIFKYMKDDEKLVLLKCIDDLLNEECLGWCLAEALSCQHNKDKLVQKWLTSEKVSNFLVDVVEKEIADECPANLSALLKLAITENENEELYVSADAVSRIIEKLIQPLLRPHDYLITIDTCASLASYLAAIVYTEKLGLTFSEDLLLALITLSCNTTIDSDNLSSDTVWEVQTAWQDAIAVLSSAVSKEDLDRVLDKIVAIVEDSLSSKKSEETASSTSTNAALAENYKIEIDKLDKYVEMLVNVCRSIHKGIPLEMERVIQRLFEHKFVKEWRKCVETICKTVEYINGKLACCYDEFGVDFDLKMDDYGLVQFFAWLYLKANVLLANLTEEDRKSYEDGDDEEEEIEKVGIWTVLDSRFGWLSDLFYDFELGCSFVDNCGTVKFCSKIKEYNSLTSSKCTQLLQNLPETDKNTLNEILKSNSYSKSWLWCRTLYRLRVNFMSEDPIKVYDELLKGSTVNDKLLVIHATQIFSEHLNYDYVYHTFDDVSRIVFLRSLARCQEIDVQIAEVMSKLETFRADNVARFNCESLKMDWTSYQMILESVRLFGRLIDYQFDNLSRRYIDLIIISLTEWMQRLAQNFDSEKVQPLIVAVCNLYQSIINKLDKLKSSDTNLALTKEWDDLFAEGVQFDLIKLWLKLAGHFGSVQNSSRLSSLPLMYCFASMTNCFDHRLIFKSSEEKSPRWSRLLKEACSLLTSPSTTLQLAAYKALMSMIPGFVEIDSVAVNSNTPSQEGLIFEQFKGICVSMQDIINAMLIGLKVGEDSCRVEACTDSYNYTLAYLLIWDILLTLCEKSSTELKFHYADWLRQEDVLSNLFNNLFRLMPSKVLLGSFAVFHTDWFSSRVALNADEVCTSDKLERLVCWIYAMTLSQLPALVRQWWSGTETRIAQIVERITSTYVSHLLCAQEFSDITRHEKKFKNMQVKIMPTIREIVAVYTVDESQMELVIVLPRNYPLAGPEVHCNRQIGGTSHKQWLMQFKKCVLHQNGRIWDGLSLWNNNLDKKFDGVEECYICFSVLHPGTYQLPKISCQTCKKKFHSACLYKWFTTSSKSTCPICRNMF